MPSGPAPSRDETHARTVPGMRLGSLSCTKPAPEPNMDTSSNNRPELKCHSVCDVAIVGAGPYGLSLAAHLNAKGIDCRVFGKPLSTWNAHMPKDMSLKSDGFASNLSAPADDSTLKAFCAARRIPYAAQGLPIALDTFLEYAESFRRRFVPHLEELNV